MFRNLIVIAGAALLIAGCSSTPSTRTVSCASSGGVYTNCERVGTSAVSLSKQVSDTPCIENVSWGVRDGQLWVDQGCRADFLVGGRAMPATTIGSSSGYGGTSLVCESDGKLTRCPANTYGGVRLARQISDSPCIYDRTWGWDTQGVWVNEGCRAEFMAGTSATVSRRTIVCESQSGRRTHCPADTRLGLDLVRQLSDSPCVRNQTWGEDRDGIWVDGGCRAEFAVRTP
ncbi:MAG: DUF3011 domain-containing protein [Acidobacteria bacterium]|nr:DUF3011 domain-containing protein [Acidobacteriota bacterium]